MSGRIRKTKKEGQLVCFNSQGDILFLEFALLLVFPYNDLDTHEFQ